MYTSYLNLFQTHTDYEMYLSGNNTIPNVIYCTDENHMHYLRSDNNPNKPSILAKNYFTLATDNGNEGVFTINKYSNKSIDYSIDNGLTWTTTTAVKTLVTASKVLIKSNDRNNEWSQQDGDGINCSVNFHVEGNIMSLLYGNDFTDKYVVPNNAFEELFNRSTNLTSAKKLILPATTLGDYCYFNMFAECINLIAAPELPATTLAESCYWLMFYGCKSLTTAPKLPATTLADHCYDSMFQGCTSLTIAPELPAITLAISCYSHMFHGCTSLTTAPELLATQLSNSCYSNMFYGCSSLNSITCLAQSVTESYTYSWVKNVATNGTFIKNPSTSNWTTGNNGIPEGWITTDAVSENYLTFNILSDGIINWKTSNASTPVKTISYSINDSEWINITSSTAGTSFNVNTGDKVRFKGNNAYYATTSSRYNTFDGSTASFDLEGNIMSLVYEVMFDYDTRLSYSHTFAYLFSNTNVIRANNLILPSIKLIDYCYYGMFNNCKNLIITPKLPATTLAYRCYSSMFYGCKNLINTPELPATILVSNCYDNMFGYCTSLIIAPELPATQLTVECYYAMFQACTSLTTAPELPATVLANNCYGFMFYSCTHLIKAPELPATILSSAVYCYSHMFHECTSLKKTPKLPATTLARSCYSNMFNGCTSLIIPPELPATTLAESCYNNMFNSCTSLITAPLLSATQLADYCYSEMFQNCTSLTIAPELPATVLASNCYASMFKGCTSLTTPPELQTTVLTSSCYANMFWNCTSLITAPELPATTLVYNCYGYMFYNCTSLNYIKCMIETPNYNHTEEWVYNVAENGTFIGSPISSWLTGANGVPEGWTTNVNIIESYESNGTIRIWLDDFGNGEEMIIDEYGSINDYFEAYIDSPWEFGGKPYEYTGETLEWEGDNYYIWVFADDTSDGNETNDNGRYILTNTIDYDELYDMSVESDYDNRICPFVASLGLDLETYNTNSNSGLFLIKVEEL